MNFLLHGMIGIVVMGACCFGSNVFPGHGWFTGSLARLGWWAAPVTGITWQAGVPLSHAVVLGCAGWLGSWTPHSEWPDVTMHISVVLQDVALVVIRNLVMLAPLTLAMWACGLFWFEMFKGAAAAVAAVSLGANVPITTPGARQGQELSGVLFGATIGLLLVSAVMIPAVQADLLEYVP